MEKSRTFIGPGGIIEHGYFGNQTPEQSLAALEKLERIIKKLESESQPILILADVSQIPKIDMGARTREVRKYALKLVRSANITRAAVYGPLKVQLIVNTLALIAGKQHKIRVFSDRAKAVKWLKQGKV